MKLNCNYCDKEFSTYPCRLKRGYKLYCSKKCSDKGLIGNKNALGHTGLVEERNHMWKGDNASYGAIHHWLYKRVGHATECLHCGKTDGKIEWANKDHKYKRNTNDYLSLCTSCHRKYDIANNNYSIGFLT